MGGNECLRVMIRVDEWQWLLMGAVKPFDMKAAVAAEKTATEEAVVVKEVAAEEATALEATAVMSGDEWC